MARVTVRIPSLLAQVIGGVQRIDVEAETLKGALDQALKRHPELELDLFDAKGSFRDHVLCFHNDTDTRWIDSLDRAVNDGDRISIVQSVSGGAEDLKAVVGTGPTDEA